MNDKTVIEPKEICRTFEVHGHTVIVDDFIYRRLFKDPDVLPRRKYTFIKGICLYSDYPHIILTIKPKKAVRLSRYIMHAVKGEFVDHRNRNPLDNRRSNLRLATARENTLNRKIKNNTGFTGISIYKLKDKSYIRAYYKTKEKKQVSFRCPDTPSNRILAALAHDKFVLQEREEEFAPLNFPCWQYEPLRSILLAEDLSKYKEKSVKVNHAKSE